MRTVKELEEKYGKKIVNRVKIKKPSGSDMYSYFVTVDGKVVANGCGASEARYYRLTMIKKLFENNWKKLLTKF